MGLEALYDRIREYYAGEKLVFSDGSMKSGLLLIGEAPGKDEVLQGRPFVGKAGKNLDAFLDVLGMDRPDICITNVCKFRPHRISEKGTVSNRPPTVSEIKQAQAFLLKEIALLDPKLIVTLGNTPLRAVLGDYSATIGDCHGRAIRANIAGKPRELFALYHPASIIYNRSLKQTYDEDIEKLRAHLNGST